MSPPEALAGPDVTGAELRTSLNPIRFRHSLEHGNDQALRCKRHPENSHKPQP